MPKFTKKFLDSLEAPTGPDGKMEIIWDTELACPEGLDFAFGVKLVPGIEIPEAGEMPSTMIFIVKGKVKGKDREFTIGRYGAVTLAEAQKKAKSILDKVQAGEDPSVQKLTISLIKNLELPDSATVSSTHQSFVWDSETKGFGVRLTTTGKSYIIQTRVNGKLRRVTLGKCDRTALDKARSKAKKMIGQMADGVDPVLAKKKQKMAATTLAEVVDAYIKDRKLKPSSVADIKKHLNGTFEPWKDSPIIKITRDNVLEKFREASAKSEAQANQAFRILRALLNYAMATYRPDDKPLILENPVKVLSDARMWHDIKARKGRIPRDKAGVAWNYIQSLKVAPDITSVRRSSADFISFLMLTGCRFSEASKLTWDRINFDANTWRIPDPKNHNPVTLPLSSQAKSILQERPKDTPYVFTGLSKKGHIVDVRFTLKNISNHIGVKITAHDLRRTFRDIAKACELELWVAKLLMNHKIKNDVTVEHYTETEDLSDLQPEIQAIGDWIERQGVLAANKVVDLQAAREVV